MSDDGPSMSATLPMPMTAHPELADRADSIRRGLDSPTGVVLWSLADPPSGTIEVATLTVGTMRAPAPWAGEPYGYAWRVAGDGVRWVAGEAYREPIHVPPWERW